MRIPTTLAAALLVSLPGVAHASSECLAPGDLGTAILLGGVVFSADATFGIMAIARSGPISRGTAIAQMILTLPQVPLFTCWAALDPESKLWYGAGVAVTMPLAMQGIAGTVRAATPENARPAMGISASLFGLGLANAVAVGLLAGEQPRTAYDLYAFGIPALALMPSVPRLLAHDGTTAAAFIAARGVSASIALAWNGDPSRPWLLAIAGYAIPGVLGVVDLATAPAAPSRKPDFASWALAPMPICTPGHGCRGVGASILGEL